MNEEQLKEKMDQLGRLLHQYEEKQLQFDLENSQLALEIAELKDQIKPEIMERKSSVKSQCLEAKYRKGAVRWETKWLDGYSIDHPELLKYRKEYPPTVAFVLPDEGWDND